MLRSMARQVEISWRRWGAVVARINRAHHLGGWQSPCTPSSVCTGGYYSLRDQKELCKSPVQEKGLCHSSGQWVLQYSSLCWVLVQFSALLVCAALAALINLLAES